MSEARRTVLPSFAKINLTLEVLNKRPDGFHNIRTIFHTISLADRITIDYEPSNAIELSIEDAAKIPDNLILRAARAVLEAAGIGGRFHFRLEKNIPMGAGLGGGSGNAAVALMAVARLTRTRVDERRIAEGLGSDVPFFLEGGCAYGEGRGTELVALPDAASRPLLVVTPGIHVSTPEAYRKLGRTTEYRAGVDHSAQVKNAIGTGAEWTSGVNDFEPPVFGVHPELASIKRRLEELGATKALMSGSGSSVLGVFGTEDAREYAASMINAACHKVEIVGREFYRQVLQINTAWE